MFPVWTVLLFLACISITVHSAVVTNSDGSSSIQKREIDSNFMRRYNHLHHEYEHNPLAFTFLKYFLRNRGQKRDRRQIGDNYYYRNNNNNNNGLPTSGYIPNNYNNGYNTAYNRYVYAPNNNVNNMYSRYDQIQRLRQVSQPQYIRYNPNNQRVRQGVSNTTPRAQNNTPKRSKPFRPPMVFF